MRFAHYTDCEVQLASDLVNTRNGDKESLVDVATLRVFLAEHEISRPGPITGQTVAEIRALRPRLRRIFEATDAEQAAADINQLLADSGALPQLSNHDGDPWHLHYTPPGVPLPARLAAETAMGLATVMREDGLDRFRTCADDTCADVFIDTSRNRSRRYCDPDTCGNRANVAAYRARQRAQQPEAEARA